MWRKNIWEAAEKGLVRGIRKENRWEQLLWKILPRKTCPQKPSGKFCRFKQKTLAKCSLTFSPNCSSYFLETLLLQKFHCKSDCKKVTTKILHKRKEGIIFLIRNMFISNETRVVHSVELILSYYPCSIFASSFYCKWYSHWWWKKISDERHAKGAKRTPDTIM